MTEPGWSAEGSPFHEGEQEAQERAGVRDRIERIGRRIVRDYMPDQHREFFAGLPMLFVGHVDGQGRPWASVLTGSPGFLTSPDSKRLDVAAEPLPGAPLAGALREGMELGLLGLEFQSRRRNRMNGKVLSLGPGVFSVAVDQSFGNCPRFIQTRDLASGADAGRGAGPKTTQRGDTLGPAQRVLVQKADTFFISTCFSKARGEVTEGVDVSHRGGKPGFVRLEDNRNLVWPDFRGNLYFNTIGNLLRDARSGLLFIDFERGDLLHLTGRCEVIWEGPQVEAFAGAERLMRFTLEEFVQIEGALPFGWNFREFSPVLEKTGDWSAGD